MGVKSTFRERGEPRTVQRGDEERTVRCPGAGWACLLPGASKQEQQADGRTASERSAVSRGAPSAAELGCEVKAPDVGTEDVQRVLKASATLRERLRTSAGESHELREGRRLQAVWPLGNREASCTKNRGRSLKSAETPSRALASSQPERGQSSL